MRNFLITLHSILTNDGVNKEISQIADVVLADYWIWRGVV